jgi:NADH-quinone oxidoreductase subunit N
MTVTASDILHQAPLLVLVVTGLVLILVEAFTRGVRRDFLMSLSVVGCLGALAASVALFRAVGDESVELFGGMLVADRLSYVLSGLFAGATAISAMLIAGHQRTHRWEVGELYGLMLIAAAGASMLSMAGSLVTIFLGIEMMSIAVYDFMAARRNSRVGTEAAMKYFLMGAFSSGILVYGIALVYGATGTMNLAEIAAFGAANPNTPVLLAGMLLMVIAFAFKIGAVPFHMWAPDTYDGAPTPITGFLASVAKAAGVIAAVRVFSEAFGGEILPFGRMGWASLFAALAAITMTVGNLAALRQESIKRMLAYSSIAHAGVILVGLTAIGVGAASAKPAVVYYLIAYAATTLGAFGIVAWIGSRGEERLRIDQWSGLAVKHPLAALAMTIFLLSLGGIPPLAGFFGKFYVFSAAVQAYDQQLLWLVVVGVLNSVLSIFYYLRVVMVMYFRNPEGEFAPTRSAATVIAIGVCAFFVIVMGVLPGGWMAIAGG